MKTKFVALLTYVPLLALSGCGAFSSQLSSLSSSALMGRTAASSALAVPACDGVTDDTATLQTQINAAVGGQLVIGGLAPCLISHALNVPTNSHITIAGTVLLSANANANMFDMENAYNVVIDGGGTIDGNWLKQGSGCGTLYACAGINALGGGNIQVGSSSARLTIQHVGNWPVNLVSVAGAQMINLNAFDSGDSVEFASGTHDCQASGLRISGIHDMGFAFYGGVVRCDLSNSIISGNSSDGVTVLSDAAQSAACSDINISNVESYGNIGSSAISIAANAGGQAPESNITVTDLYSHDNGRNDVFDPSGANVTFVRLKTVGQAQIIQNGSITMISPIQIGSTATTTTTTTVPTSSNPAPVSVSVPADASILGVIDGVFPDGQGGSYIAGWACLTHDPASIPVDLYLNGSAGSPGAVGIARFQSGLASESAVAASCLAGGSSYRFAVPLSASLVNSYHGATIYLHGISPIAGFSNNLLVNSGTFKIP